MTQVFVSGTWNATKAAPYADQAVLLGRRIAEAGFDLSCGPGTGIARHVVDGYRSIEPRGAVRFYLPLRSEMEAVGEIVDEGWDDLVETEFDYPMRNVFQVSQSAGLFVLTGGDGTLEEILPALIDYQIPVAIVDGSGTASIAVRSLLEIYPEWSDLVEFTPTVDAGITSWIRRVREKAHSSATEG